MDPDPQMKIKYKKGKGVRCKTKIPFRDSTDKRVLLIQLFSYSF